MIYPFPSQCPEYPSMNVSIPGCFQFLKTSSVPFVDRTESILTPFLPRLFIIIFSTSLIPLYLNGSLWYFISLLYFAVKLLFLSPVSFCCLYLLSSLLSAGLHHIELSDRVVVGKDGNLYFAHLTIGDSRNDYTCNVQYLATRTILAKEPITLNVSPCEFCFG